MTEQVNPPPAKGHRIPDAEWAQVVEDAAAFAAGAHPAQLARPGDPEPGPEPDEAEDDDGARHLAPRRLTRIVDWTARGRATGKYFPVSGIPTQLVVMHSMECPLQAGYAESVTNWAITTAVEASWHRGYGPDARVYFIPDELGAWHASEANPLSIGFEQAGYAAYTRAQWTTADGLRQLDTVAYDVAQVCKRDGITPRMLTTAEVRAVLDGGNRSIKGICFHRQIDPETRTDPGNGYPADLLIAKVKAYMAPAPTKDWLDMVTKAEFDAAVGKVDEAVWARTVVRGGKKVSAIQELADSKTLGESNAKALAALGKLAADQGKVLAAQQKSIETLNGTLAKIAAALQQPPAAPPAPGT